MKQITVVLMVVILAVAPATAQKKKKGAPPKRKPTTKAAAPAAQSAPPIIGANVEIVTRNGDRVAGQLLDLNGFNIRIRADGVESTIGFDTIESLSFGEPPARPVKPAPAAGSPSGDFARDAGIVLAIFQSLAASLQTGIDYNEFGPRIAELRRGVERLVAKNAGTDNIGELRVISLLIAGLTDYGWSRAIWTLKFGRSSDGTASETDSRELADAFATYPEIRAAAASGNRYAVDKVISLLWKKASEKSARARSLVGTSN